MARQLEQQKSIYSQAEAEIRAPSTNNNNSEDAMSGFVERMKEISAQVPKIAWTRDSEFGEFRNSAWEILQEGRGEAFTVPSLVDDEGCEDGDGDDDLVMVNTGNRTDLICPITRVQMVDPVQNPTCKHTYSRAAIEQMGRQSNECPVPGCNRAVTLSRLVKNEGVERKLQRMTNRLFPIRP